jgi:hypothetical protein
MTLPESVASDRPALRRRGGVLSAVVISSVLAVQVSLLYSQTRVLARQERVLRDREAVLQRVNDVADRIATNLERFSDLHQNARTRAVHFERPPGDEQPVVILPLPE